ncbi:MAG: hypothetical protein JNM65_08860 [Verrucomicrobiaceae bacterium]|nr:hypothetical protein [Verrucomicrobiaceae bacterium]
MRLTSGLIISVTRDDEAAGLRAVLSARDDVTPGEPEGRWLPAAIEAEDDARLRELHDWIASRPGVAFVDVVHVNFDDSTTPEPLLNPLP